MNTLFVRSLYKIAKVILVSYTGLQAEILLNLKIFFWILRNYTTSSNSLFTIILGNFNVRSSVWWTKDKTTTEGTQPESVTSVHGFHQLISQPTHLLPQSSSCIDLIFTDQPNLIVDSGVHPSLHSNCHHQITHCKLSVYIEYSPPYEHLVWDSNKTNVETIKKSIESVNFFFLPGFSFTNIHESLDRRGRGRAFL